MPGRDFPPNSGKTAQGKTLWRYEDAGSVAGSVSHQIVFRLHEYKLSNLIFRANFVKFYFELAIFPTFSGILSQNLKVRLKSFAADEYHKSIYTIYTIYTI